MTEEPFLCPQEGKNETISHMLHWFFFFCAAQRVKGLRESGRGVIRHTEENHKTESNRVLWYYLSQALTKLLSLPSLHIAPLPRGSASKRPTNSQWGRWELFLICVNVKQVWTCWTLTNERQRPGKRGTFYSAGSTKLLSSAEAYFLLNGSFMITLISDHTLEGEWNVWSHDSCMDNPLIYSKAKGRLGLFMLIPSVLVLVQDLADDLSSELSGNFRSVVLGLLMLAPVYDAHELRNAMKVLLNSLY